jgi:hypothetical protein
MNIVKLLSDLNGAQIVFAIYALVHAIFVFSKWSWIKTALTEANGNPSALRLSGFMVINAIIFCFVGHCCLSWALEASHLLYMLVFAGALYGIIKASQALALRGVKDPEADKAEPTT